MGINMKRAGKFNEALSYYKSALDLDPVNSIVLYNTGILHNIRSEYPEAISHLEKSIDYSKDNVYAYLALGDALERQKEYKEALKVYRELTGLGTKVHGLKERITYLEGVISTEIKQQAAKQEREKEHARQLKVRAQEEQARQEKEEERKAREEERKQKIEEDRKAKKDEKKRIKEEMKDMNISDYKLAPNTKNKFDKQ